MPRDYGVDSVPFRIAPPRLRQTYRITVVCHGAEANAVESELRDLFLREGLAIESFDSEQTSFAFVRITASLAGSMAERPAVVRIVHRLAMMTAIRRLHWEAIPDR